MNLNELTTFIKELLPIISVISFFIVYLKFKGENEKQKNDKLVDETNQKNKVEILEKRVESLEIENEKINQIQATILKMEIHFENLSKKLDENLKEIKMQICKD